MPWFLFLIILLFGRDAAASARIFDQASRRSFDVSSVSLEGDEDTEKERLDWRVTLDFAPTSYEGREFADRFHSVQMDIWTTNTLEDLKRHLNAHITEGNAWWYSFLVVQQVSANPSISFRDLYDALWNFKPFNAVGIQGIPSLRISDLVEGGKRFSTLSLINYSLTATLFHELFGSREYRNITFLDLSESRIARDAMPLAIPYSLRWFECCLPFLYPNKHVYISLLQEGRLLFRTLQFVCDEGTGQYCYRLFTEEEILGESDHSSQNPQSPD